MATDPIDRARGFMGRGWAPIPVPHREKVPDFTSWQTLRVSPDDLPQYFNGNPLNVSVLLGDPSTGLVDIDLDALEALPLAPLVLPATAAKFGRASKPESHWLYTGSPLPRTEKFQDPRDPGSGDDKTAMLVEIRSTGCQTVFPGSTHPSGEEIRWDQDGEPARLDGAVLRDRVARLAALALLARRWPGAGTRHEVALAAAGFLARAGFDEALVVRAIGAIARLADDPEWSDRQRAARDTVAKVAAGEPVTGGPRLADLLTGDGEKAVRQLRRWLGVEDTERPSLTDSGNAIRFARQHGEHLRYCWVWDQWFEYDDRRWARDPGDRVVARAKETARAIYAEAAQETDSDRRKAVAAWAVKSESEPGIRRMLELAKSEPGIPVLPSELDRDVYLLNTASGTLETRTLALRPHRHEDLITKVTAAPYIPGARHPVFDAYLDRVLPDDTVRAFVQRAAGYALTGSTAEEVLFFAHGPGASGKSTMLKGLRMALGDYAMTADFTSFTERRANGPKEDIARLAGARLVVSVEVKDGTRLAEGLIKWLTGGDDITARRLYEQSFEFTPHFKLMLAANHRPWARDDDDAFWRRIIEIPFTESIPEGDRDPSVKATLCDPDQAGPAILAWAAEGAAAWFQGGLAIPEAVRHATRAYRQDTDPLAPFLATCCVLELDASVTAGELRTAYEAWAKEEGIRYPLGGQAWGERLRAKGCTAGRRHGGVRAWRGIRLRGLSDPDSEPRVVEEGSPW
jgi:P4 family phage/plasmid primase-like protien